MGTYTPNVAGGEGGGYSLQRRPENLALVFQEVLTAIVRLRTNRQVVTDAEVFRAQMREAFRAADQDGRTRGYTAEQIKLSIFALVAFLDESVLNLHQPVFAQWHRKPLQEEMFGIDVAGEIFFHNIQRLLGQRDSHDLADVLEIYELALLLGFRGRYGMGGQAELRSVIETIKEKLRRIRGGSLELSPAWALPPGKFKVIHADPWVKRLFWTAVGCLVLMVLLFSAYKISLSSRASDVEAIPAQAQVQG
jgi:type VI secretion system protein ImpK